jgi:hypothetical protein
MMRAPMSLVDLQREMAAAVTMPLTSDEDMRSHRYDGRPMSEVAESFIAPNSRLTAFERLEIYNRQYWFRVLGALVEDFPALRVLLGARKFDALSVAYLAAHPSRSFSLRNLGSHVVDWLMANRRYAGRRHAVAIDIARIEWAFVEAFDGAEHKPLTLEQIATLDGESRLAIQPHVRLLALDYAADELVVALHNRDKRQASEAGIKHEDEDAAPFSLPPLRRRAIWVAAHRLDFSVYYRRLQHEEYRTLSALRAGQPLGSALEEGFAHSTMSMERRSRAVREWFAAWAELAWIYFPNPESDVEASSEQ